MSRILSDIHDTNEGLLQYASGLENKEKDSAAKVSDLRAHPRIRVQQGRRLDACILIDTQCPKWDEGIAKNHNQ